MHAKLVCGMISCCVALGISGCSSMPSSPSGGPTSPVRTVSQGQTSLPLPDGQPSPTLVIDRSRLDTELHLYNWVDYLDPQILRDFQKEYGVTVIENLYDSNETMIDAVEHSVDYDVVVPSDYAVELMIQKNMLAPLDRSLLPNFGHLDITHLGLFFDPENRYTIPYFWSTTGIAYNSKAFPTPPDSWAILFDPEHLAPFKGRATMLEDQRETPGAALIYLGAPINSIEPGQIQQAEDLLRTQRPLLREYNSASYNALLANEDVMLAHAWGGGAAQAWAGLGDLPANPNIHYIIPKEGGTIWQDNVAILASSTRKYTAHVFLNYLMRPDIAARNADYTLYLTPNRTAMTLLQERTKNVYAAGFLPDAETLKRLQWIRRSPEIDAQFGTLWSHLQSTP